MGTVRFRCLLQHIHVCSNLCRWMERYERSKQRQVSGVQIYSQISHTKDFNDVLNGFCLFRKVYFREHRCFGDGANQRGRVPYSKELTDSQASHFTSISYIDGDQWLHWLTYSTSFRIDAAAAYLYRLLVYFISF